MLSACLTVIVLSLPYSCVNVVRLVVRAGLGELGAVARTIAAALCQVGRAALVGDEDVVAAVLLEVQLVVGLSLADLGGVAGAGLVGGHAVADAVLGEVGDVVGAVLIDGCSLGAAELSSRLRAFPVAGVDLVFSTDGAGVEYMAIAAFGR